MTKRICIVGCGLFGATVANLLADKYYITIIDKRNHIAGNIFDYTDPETGIIIHKYGPHILHIDDTSILSYINKFAFINDYNHHVMSCYNDILYEFPINLSTINKFFNTSLTPYEAELMIKKNAHVKSTYSNLEEKIIDLIGKELYNAFFREYTIKQWGKDPTSLPPSIIDRIPIKFNYNTNYYKKKFNGIPVNGYTSMIKHMLYHKNINILLNLDFFKNKDLIPPYDYLIFTGPIDQFFSYKYGRLQYRGLKFIHKKLEIPDYQGLAVVNYPQLKYSFTRICEHKHFYAERKNIYLQPRTIITYEIPINDRNPQYPIRGEKDLLIYTKYKNECSNLDNIFFGGRFGEYKYYDMEDCIRSAMRLSYQLL